MSLEIEKKVLHHLINFLANHGWVPSNVDDGGDDLINCEGRTHEGIIEDVTAVEDATITFTRAGRMKQVRYIMGNDWDCIADHAMGHGFDTTMDEFYESLEAMQNPPKETNVAMLTRVMNFSKHGALMQPFVLEALSKYCDQVIERQDEVRESMRESLVNADAWIGCAVELKAELDKHFS